MARVVLSSAAFWGDVLPYVPVGRELVARGHDVVYSLPRAHHEVLRDEPFELHDNRSTFTHHDVLADPAQLRMLERQQGSATGTAMVRYWARRYLADEADQWVDSTAAVLDGADVLVTHPTAATLSSIPAQAAGIPWVVGHLFPSMIPSARTDPAGLDLSRLPAPVARRVRRALWRTSPVLASPLMQDGAINRVRARFGLAPKRGNMLVAWMDADATAVLVSPRYTPPQPDWPDRVVTTGFTTWTGPPGVSLDPAVAAHLDAGEPPVLVTMGTSTATIAGPILRDVSSALDGLGLRGLFLVGTEANERALDGVPGVFRFAPLGAVLDRCRAVVHQGGHGTVAATLEAGIPSVAIPMGFDQVAHGRRLTELGVGRAVDVRRRDPSTIERALVAATAPELVDRARALGAAIAAEDGVGATCDLIERAAAG